MASTTRNRAFIVAALFVALALACVVSYWASSKPDGLEKVSADKGIDANARTHDLADSPFADYGTKGVDNPRASVAVAGAAGVLITLVVGGGIFYVVGRGRKASDDTAAGATSTSSA